MSQSVEGQKCPICNGYMFDEEEIAYCPVCGAPHHRACYLSAGDCGYAQTHGTPQQYQPPRKEKNEVHSETQAPAQKVCPGCGKPATGEGNFCAHCGRPLTGPQSPSGQLFFSTDPLAGLNKKEAIEPGSDITVEEAAQYIGPNVQRYLPRFRQLGKKKKTSWNWAAFFFPQGWFFFRKIYLPGVLFFILSMATTMLMYSVYSLFAKVPVEMQKSTALMLDYLSTNLTAADLPVMTLVSVGSVTNLLMRVFAALFGDYLYRSSALNRIAEAKKAEEYAEQPQLVLRKKGWVNLPLGILGLFGVTWICYFIYSLL